MSRTKHGDTIRPWMSARADCKEGRFIQCGNSLLLSKAFQKLSAGAQIAYLCMSMESGGKKDFIFPLSAAKKYGIPKNSLTRYVHELSEKGFITVQSMANLRQPNEYSFSNQWKMSESINGKP